MAVPGTLRHRGLVVLLFAVVALGLVAIGARLPQLLGIYSHGKPKPRNRAVVQTQVTVCKQCIEHQGQQCETVSGVVLPPVVTGHLPASPVPLLPDFVSLRTCIPARAPPAA